MIDQKRHDDTRDARNTRDIYTQVEAHLIPTGPHYAAPHACPVCGADAALWRFVEAPDMPIQYVVMCKHDEPIGPQNGLMNEGCLLYMPPDGFYQPTMREALRYWNEFAHALISLFIERQMAKRDKALDAAVAKITPENIPDKS